jgi:hypothetical protein
MPPPTGTTLRVACRCFHCQRHQNGRFLHPHGGQPQHTQSVCGTTTPQPLPTPPLHATHPRHGAQDAALAGVEGGRAGAGGSSPPATAPAGAHAASPAGGRSGASHPAVVVPVRAGARITRGDDTEAREAGNACYRCGGDAGRTASPPSTHRPPPHCDTAGRATGTRRCSTTPAPPPSTQTAWRRTATALRRVHTRGGGGGGGGGRRCDGSATAHAPSTMPRRRRTCTCTSGVARLTMLPWRSL